MLGIEVSFYTLPEYYPVPRSSGATLLTELIIKHNSYIKLSDYQVLHKANQKTNKKDLLYMEHSQGENKTVLCFLMRTRQKQYGLHLCRACQKGM